MNRIIEYVGSLTLGKQLLMIVFFYGAGYVIGEAIKNAMCR